MQVKSGDFYASALLAAQGVPPVSPRNGGVAGVLWGEQPENPPLREQRAKLGPQVGPQTGEAPRGQDAPALASPAPAPPIVAPTLPSFPSAPSDPHARTSSVWESAHSSSVRALVCVLPLFLAEGAQGAGAGVLRSLLRVQQGAVSALAADVESVRQALAEASSEVGGRDARLQPELLNESLRQVKSQVALARADSSSVDALVGVHAARAFAEGQTTALAASLDRSLQFEAHALTAELAALRGESQASGHAWADAWADLIRCAAQLREVRRDVRAARERVEAARAELRPAEALPPPARLSHQADLAPWAPFLRPASVLAAAEEEHTLTGELPLVSTLSPSERLAWLTGVVDVEAALPREEELSLRLALGAAWAKRLRASHAATTRDLRAVVADSLQRVRLLQRGGEAAIQELRAHPTGGVRLSSWTSPSQGHTSPRSPQLPSPRGLEAPWTHPDAAQLQRYVRHARGGPGSPAGSLR